jgi:hypothetical protein
MNKAVDENEHSLEMHLPYIKKTLPDVKLVPIMVGNLSADQEKQFGQKISAYMGDDTNLFIVSSDFCHWGSNFDYYRQDKSLEAWQSVEKLDKQGMQLIENHDYESYHQYLEETENTICGRHPIGVFLNAIRSYANSANIGEKIKTKFVKYA